MLFLASAFGAAMLLPFSLALGEQVMPARLDLRAAAGARQPGARPGPAGLCDRRVSAAGRRPRPADPAGDLGASSAGSPMARRCRRSTGSARRRSPRRWCWCGCPSGACARPPSSPVSAMPDPSPSRALRAPPGPGGRRECGVRRLDRQRGRCRRRPARDRPGQARLAMPKAQAAMVDVYIQAVDRALEEHFTPERLAGMKIREKIRALVWQRLEIMVPAREAVRRGLAILAMPQNVPLALRIGWRTADLMWRHRRRHQHRLQPLHQAHDARRRLRLDPAGLARRPERGLERDRRLPRPAHRRRDEDREMEGRVARLGRPPPQPVALPRPACATRRAEPLVIDNQSQHAMAPAMATSRPALVLALCCSRLARWPAPRRPQRTPDAEVQTTLAAARLYRRRLSRGGRAAAGSINPLEYDEMIEFSRFGRPALAALPAKPARAALLAEAKALAGGDRRQGRAGRGRRAARKRSPPTCSPPIRCRWRRRRAPDLARGAAALRRELRVVPRRQGRGPERRRSPSSIRRRSPSPTAPAPASAACSRSTR